MFPTVHGVVSQGGQGTPPEPGDGYRYYRLRFRANNGRETLNVAEVELRATAGGPNVAVGGTPSASSEYGDGFRAGQAFDANANTYWSTLAKSVPTASSDFLGFPASYAFDANPNSFWSTASAVTAAWIRWDAGGAAEVNRYRIRARHDAGNGAPKDWTLEYSDDATTWSTAHAVTNETAWANGEEREFTFPSVGSHRFWRLNITATNGRSTINIAEMGFNDAQQWLVWLQYDLGIGNEKDIAQYVIRAHPNEATGAPRDWSLEGSNDLATWVVLDAVTGETGWSNGEQRVFTL